MARRSGRGVIALDAAKPLTPLGAASGACSPARGERTSGALFALGLALVVAATAPALADKVGVAAAVNPDAFSSLNGSPKTQLNIGKSIFYDEHINTTGSGLVQVLLIDGSTFTVGPGSDLTIDKFVYDPNKKTGEIAASFSKGVMRFVGGKISKNEGGVTVDTPAGALAIRGGMFQTNGKVFSFLYGDHMTLTGKNGQSYNVFQPGNSIDVSSGTPIVRPTTSADINSVMAALTNGSGGATGNPTGTDTGPTPGQKYTSVETLSLQNLISQATQTQINGQINDQEQQGTTETPGTPGTPQSPQPIPINARVLTPPNSFTAYGQRFENPSDNGILGGDANADVNADDFIWQFDLGTGRFQGTVSGLNDGSGDFKPGTVDFPFVGLQGQDGIFPINPQDGATITQLDQPFHYVGYVAVEHDFFAYNLISTEGGNDHPERLLAFGGSGYDFGAAGGKIYRFNLTADPGQSEAFGPFASTNSSPVTLPLGTTTYPTDVFTSDAGNGFISPLVALEKDGSGPNDPSHAVWLQTSFFVGRGDQQGSSFINVALGEWDPQTGMTGFRRGGSIVLGPNEYSSTQTYSFSGDIASLAGPDANGNLSYFMGSDNPNIVIGADSTGTHNIFRDTPLDPTEGDSGVEQQSSATYHVGIGQGPTTSPIPQTSGTFTGYAAGFAQHPDSSRPDFVANFSPSDVTLSFDAATNTMEGSFKLKDIQPNGLGLILTLLNKTPQFNLGFGGPGRSAFIDNNTFAAIEKSNGSTADEIVRSGFLGLNTTTYSHEASVEGFVVSADAIQANEILFSGQTAQTDHGLVQKRAFCQSCDFIKWGAWGARIDYQQHNGQTATADVPLGWWIAGNVVTANDMPTTGKASYAGDAIGNVVNGGRQYTATGNMNMDWNFGKRSGLLTISQFDNNRSFSGLMVAPGKVAFSGPLAGSGLVGAANGAFVGHGGPQGVIGNFGVGNSSYQATGIFGGLRQ